VVHRDAVMQLVQAHNLNANFHRGITAKNSHYLVQKDLVVRDKYETVKHQTPNNRMDFSIGMRALKTLESTEERLNLKTYRSSRTLRSFSLHLFVPRVLFLLFLIPKYVGTF